jgi:hypothetical protein
MAAAVVIGRQRALHLGQRLVPVGVQFDLGVGRGRHSRLGQADFKFDRGFCRVDAEIGERGVPHIVDHEGEKPEHGRGGEAVPDDIARAAIPASEIDGQNDGDGEGGCHACQPRHQHAEPAVRAVVGQETGAVGDHFEKRGHGVAGEFGRTGRALQEWGRKVHRSISPVALKPVRD